MPISFPHLCSILLELMLSVYILFSFLEISFLPSRNRPELWKEEQESFALASHWGWEALGSPPACLDFSAGVRISLLLFGGRGEKDKPREPAPGL